ncbi:hypothetical protein G3A43_06850 [Paraburkholderia aspalathi]|nr:hypothetical protein [Paraburkholderia aspalathi]MBK3779969.1 hypothetical protein [Paraburkholderia aspalathi]
MAPEVVETFKYMQERAHARSVGEFEELLSLFVDDVIPDAGRIHLELGHERGAPALDIMLDNSGDMESILYGNGGGLTNVVVTGLGYSALSRTNNRPLMLLDEPDCWLKSVNVPNFVKVIAEVANPREEEDGSHTPGVQTLMISHNDATLMADGAHIQDLRVDADVHDFAARHGVRVDEVGEKTDCAYVVWVPHPGDRAKGAIEIRYRPAGEGDDERNALTKGYPYVESIEGVRAWASPEEVGVRWIEVTNVRSHVRTRMKLSSGLNVLTGHVNAGKSNLYFTSLRAMAYGESDDTMIRHGADSAIIRIGLEGGVELEMVRTRKGSPKVQYRRFIGGKMVNEGRPEKNGAVPEFITESLRVQRVDDLDIQLRSQKSPVFLLDESPSRRARLLSVGRESGLLQDLIEKHRLELKRDREQVKRDEIELNLVNRKLLALSPLAGMSALKDIMDMTLEDAKQGIEKIGRMRATVARLAPLAPLARLQVCIAGKLDVAIAMPELKDTKPLSDVIVRLARNVDVARLPLPPAAPAVPALTDTRELAGLIDRLRRGAHASVLAAALPQPPKVPELADTGLLVALVSRLQTSAFAQVLHAHLPTAPAFPTVHDTTGLRRIGVTLARGKQAIDTASTDEQAVQAELTTAEMDLQKTKDDIGVCPLCSTPFGQEHHHD